MLVASQFHAHNYRGSGPVTVTASVTHPSTSWRTALEAGTADDGTPLVSLYGEPPAATAGAAMTPFYVTAELPPTAATVVHVRDDDGTRDAPIRYAHPE